LSAPNKEIEELLSETEIKMAVDAMAYEDAAWLEALADEVNKGVDPSEIDREWSKLEHIAEKTLAKQKKKKYPIKRIAAVFIFVFILIPAIAFVTVDAFRAYVLNVTMEFGEKSSVISFNKDEFANESKTDFAPKYIPDGYELTDTQDLDRGIMFAYFNGQNQSIYISVFSEDVSQAVDTENADKVEETLIGSYEGLIVVKNQTTQIVWGDTDRELIITVLTESLDEEEAMHIAESFYNIEGD